MTRFTEKKASNQTPILFLFFCCHCAINLIVNQLINKTLTRTLILTLNFHTAAISLLNRQEFFRLYLYLNWLILILLQLPYWMSSNSQPPP
jgi:hypothetical protein